MLYFIRETTRSHIWKNQFIISRTPSSFSFSGDQHVLSCPSTPRLAGNHTAWCFPSRTHRLTTNTSRQVHWPQPSCNSSVHPKAGFLFSSHQWRKVPKMREVTPQHVSRSLGSNQASFLWLTTKISLPRLLSPILLPLPAEIDENVWGDSTCW